MCTLYKLRRSVEEIARLLGPLENPGVNLPVFDEIYPNYEAPVVTRGEDGARRLELLRWGVPPPGAGKRPVVNVRNLQSPFWKNMLANPARRCLVPVEAFAEWTGEKGSKTKVWFGVKDTPLFAFAGIWRPVGGAEEPPRMAFLTCAPNRLVGGYHPQAMPVILAPEDHEAWFASDYDGACALARPYPDERMEIVADAAGLPAAGN